MENMENLSQEQTKDSISATIPENNEMVVPVKYNKQILNLDIETAGNLAQKGLKFDSISDDFEKLKKLALGEGKSVKEYINALEENVLNSKREKLAEKCGGDVELVEHILKLESAQNQQFRGFDELKAKFPEIKDLESLPESVLQNAQLKGSLLLDEYLRYKLEQEMAVKNNNLQQTRAKVSTTGSQQSKKGNYNPETIEFLKGLWNK